MAGSIQMRVRHVRRSQLPESIVKELKAPCVRHAALVAELGSAAQPGPPPAGAAGGGQQGGAGPPQHQETQQQPKRKAAEQWSHEATAASQRPKN